MDGEKYTLIYRFPPWRRRSNRPCTFQCQSPRVDVTRTQPTDADGPRSAPDEPTSGETALSRRQATRIGLTAGAVATVVMTVFRMPTSRSPPPTARLAAAVAGGEPADHTLVGLLLHLIYGTVAGGVFGLLAGSHLPGSDLGGERRGALLGSVYGLALSAFGLTVLLKRVLRIDLDADERFVFHVSHLIYGLALGILVGSRS